MADWDAIKADYITGSGSYRFLAKKYGVSASQICRVGSDQGWVALRDRHRSEVLAKALAEKADYDARELARQCGRVDDLAMRLAEKVERAIDKVDPEDIANMRRLAATLRDIRDVVGEVSPLERQEREARIAVLRRQADKDDDGGGAITVVMTGEVQDYAQ